MEIDRNNINLNNIIAKAKIPKQTVNLPYSKNVSQPNKKLKYDVFINNEIQNIKSDFEKTKSQQGLIGTIWDKTKNLFGMKSGSKYIKTQIKAFKEGKVSKEELQKVIESYKQGQTQVVDVVADLFSASAAAACYAAALGGAVAAPFTGGASLSITAAAIAGSTAAGAATKTLIKGLDARTGGRDYTYKDCLTDAAMGAINGPLAAATAGAGLLVAKAGTKIGMPIAKAALASMENQVVVGLGKATTKATVIETAIWANANNLNRNITMSVSKEAMKEAPLSEIRKTGQFLFKHLRTNNGEKLSKKGLQRLTAIVTQWAANTSSTPLLGGAKIGFLQKLGFNVANGAFIGAVFGAGTSASSYTINSVANDTPFSTNELIANTSAGIVGGAVFGAGTSAGGTVIGKVISNAKSLPGGKFEVQKGKTLNSGSNEALIISPKGPKETELTLYYSKRPLFAKTHPKKISHAPASAAVSKNALAAKNNTPISNIYRKDLLRVRKLKTSGLSDNDLLILSNMSDKQLANIEKRQLLSNYEKLKETELDPLNTVIRPLSEFSDSQYKKYCSLLNDERVINNEDIKFYLIEISGSNNSEEIINFMAKYPGKIESNVINDLYNLNKGIFPYVDECYAKGNYEIGTDNIKRNEMKVINKDTGLPITVSANGDTLSFRIITKNQKGDFIARVIIKAPEGIYISSPATGSLEEITRGMKDTEVLKSFKKIEIGSESMSFEKLEELAIQENISGNTVFRADSPLKAEHAEFDLPQGKTTISKANGTTIMQMDNAAKPNSTSERIVYHYPDGRVSTVDFGTDTVSVFEPNKSGTGVTETYIAGNQEIKLTSEIQDELIRITNDKTGKTLSVPTSVIIDSLDFKVPQKGLAKLYLGDIKQISTDLHKVAAINILRKLSPTTILNLLKYKQIYPDAKLPYLKDGTESFCSSSNEDIKAIALSDSPHIVSHEFLHFTTEHRNLTNGNLKDIHLQEAKANSGLIRNLSAYATDGQIGDFERGLHELLSIGGTMNEYGAEMSLRSEATRLAFPKTLKEASKAQMQHYQNLIDEMIEKGMPAQSIPEPVVTPNNTKPQSERPTSYSTQNHTESPQKYQSTLLLRDENGKLILDDNKKRESVVRDLCNNILNGKEKISNLSVNQILDIWSWRKYEKSLGTDTKAQKDFFKRFNNICENSIINVHDNEVFIRTIPEKGHKVPPAGQPEPKLFTLGKDITRPAAAARAKLNPIESGTHSITIKVGENDTVAEITSLLTQLPKYVIERIVKDKVKWMSDNPTATPKDSTIYIIKPNGKKPLIGFDWQQTGKVGPDGNGFGSIPFYEYNVDSQGYSTEVDFPGSTNFKKEPNNYLTGKTGNITFPNNPEMPKIKIKLVYVIPA